MLDPLSVAVRVTVLLKPLLMPKASVLTFHPLPRKRGILVSIKSRNGEQAKFGVEEALEPLTFPITPTKEKQFQENTSDY